MDMQVWTIEDGLKLVRALQPETRQFGYHLAMGGSVLNTGGSDKDLDLYFLPLDNDKHLPNALELVKWLESLWGGSKSISASGGKRSIKDYVAQMRGRNPAPEVPANPVGGGAEGGGFNWFVAPGNYRIVQDAHGHQVIEQVPPPEAAKPEPEKPSIYKHKLKFDRPDGRIDVFIL